ncbi:DUF5047 domain-containing protein [Micromonospora haikouensis]|uniref:DUF5047 domain-containing protein n=1 Tax=Micromonospora haikouensis TaxID=686309 RepID=UPI0037923797
MTGSHRVAVRARVVAAGTTGSDPPGVDLPVEGGDVQLDATATVRSTLSLTVPGVGWWPSTATSPLAPYGAEVWVARGIAYGDGLSELVSLGYHRIDTVEQSDAPRGAVQISARDRMAGLSDARLLAPIQYQAGTTLGDIVDELVREVYPSAVIEWDDLTDLAELGRAVIAEEDRHAFLDDLVTAAGKVWWWDHRGHLVIRSVPTPTEPVLTVAGGEGGALVSLSRELSREGVYNGVVAYGEGADTVPPARAVAVDSNQQSPTWWGGPFGKVPRFYSSPFITTDAQAQSAAEAMLTKALGLPYSVDFSLVPNPALEPHDPVRIAYPGRSEVHVVERLTVPLTAAGVMTAATREQTLIAVGVI